MNAVHENCSQLAKIKNKIKMKMNRKTEIQLQMVCESSMAVVIPIANQRPNILRSTQIFT